MLENVLSIDIAYYELLLSEQDNAEENVLYDFNRKPQ